MVGENGEKVAATGEEAGKMWDDSGGDSGRCGGGVTTFGVPGSDVDGECTGEMLLGENCPWTWSDVVGEFADTGLFSTSRSNEDKNVGSSALLRAAAVDDSGWLVGARGR